MLANAQQERCDEMLPRVLRHVCQARSIIAGRMVSRSIEAPLILFAALNGLLETVVALISARADVDVPMMMPGEHGAGRTWRHGPLGGCRKRPCPMRECNDLCRQASPFPLRLGGSLMPVWRQFAVQLSSIGPTANWSRDRCSRRRTARSNLRFKARQQHLASLTSVERV